MIETIRRFFSNIFLKHADLDHELLLLKGTPYPNASIQLKESKATKNNYNSKIVELEGRIAQLLKVPQQINDDLERLLTDKLNSLDKLKSP